MRAPPAEARELRSRPWQPAAESMVVKVAAVVGTMFTLDMLRHAMIKVNLDESSAEVYTIALDLCRAGVLTSREHLELGSYTFAHKYMHDVAYGQIAVELKTKLHEVCAAWLERCGRSVQRRSTPRTRTWCWPAADRARRLWSHRLARHARRLSLRRWRTRRPRGGLRVRWPPGAGWEPKRAEAVSSTRPRNPRYCPPYLSPRALAPPRPTPCH